MKFLSAGHNLLGTNPDPGAVHGPYKEAALAIDLRDRTIAKIQAAGYNDIITDRDDERLATYLGRIKPGSGSVVCEIHFNAGPPTATGVECLYAVGASKDSIALATRLSQGIAQIMGIKNRGAKDESESQHSRLGILHTKAGIAVLPEICFISNDKEMETYETKKDEIADFIAQALIQYDNTIS